MAWDDIATVGLEPIDQDHHQLALILSRLGAALTAAETMRVLRLCSLLVDQFHHHVRREQRLLPATDAADLRHAKITRMLRELTDTLSRPTMALGLIEPLRQELREEAADDAVLVKATCGHALDRNERRRYLRYCVAMEVSGRLADGRDLGQGGLVDISRGGCLFGLGNNDFAGNVGEEVVLEVMGDLLPGVLVGSSGDGHHVRFNDDLTSDQLADILTGGIIDPVLAAVESERAQGC